jgi:hypothetical protein
MDLIMDNKAAIYGVRLGAETYFPLPENGKFEASEGFVITKIDVEAGAVFCKPLQIEVDLNGHRQWVTSTTK